MSSVAVATAVAAGELHNCAALAGGGVACWGSNQFGQMGNGGDPAVSVAVPVFATSVAGATSVAAGRHHGCAVASGGAVWCWGMNDSGQLGDGTIQDRPEPILVTSVANATAIAVGGFHACAIVSGGQVKCWGDNTYGTLAADPQVVTSSAVPRDVDL